MGGKNWKMGMAREGGKEEGGGVAGKTDGRLISMATSG